MLSYQPEAAFKEIITLFSPFMRGAAYELYYALHL